MDGSNNGNEGSGSSGDGDGSRRMNMVYADNMRKRFEDIANKAKILAELRSPYDDEARRQIANALGTQELPIWYRVGGVNKDKLLSHGQGLIASIAAVNGQSLTNPQVQAVAENLQSSARSIAMLSWGTFGCTAFLAFKHRNHVPKRLIGRRWLRFGWPAILFVMYSIPMDLVVEPFFGALNARMHSASFKNDPRIQGLDIDINKAINQYRPTGQEGGQPQYRAFESQSTPEMPARFGQSSASNEESGSEYGGRSAYTWPSKQPEPRQQDQGRDDRWDGFNADDDASPVAKSARNTQLETGGSAWDRIRQQSIPQGQKLQQTTWQQTSQPAQSSGGWGENQSTNTSRDSYTYSSSDFEKATAKDQAQRDFDRLLERERSGVDPETKWGRK